MKMSNSQSETELFEAYCQGQQEALGVLYLRLEKVLLLHSYRICEDREMAHDCVAELFEYLLQQSSQERNKFIASNSLVNVQGWFYTLIKNRTLDAMRHKAMRKRSYFEFGRWLLGGNGHNEISTGDYDKEKLLALLSAREKEAFELYADGHQYQQIADRLDISSDTVKTLIRRGKEKLRRLKNLI
ncbi:RNA polymerase sigma factor, sigma-70 family [Flexibacter flexilis DSM 6793]|uniref:RNA polymerase sigma factor, sigma-70 family n=1 Tax=Flexibacter flexilis DSM 6793 TaxID=927664 RepID=A0A1I1DPP4_9BACT|nr:RNA polymerase sigma factor [Flexibacter flexilis]SFB74670.1 RNA polymerase sigma factor, sigma-70 family [Flexibacter flexilis DSM 6793]